LGSQLREFRVSKASSPTFAEKHDTETKLTAELRTKVENLRKN
jgi:hypothetical protein